MKRILVFVLCFIMAACPALAEGSQMINVEKVGNLAAELGFEGATGEETVVPAGEGYYVLWREDLIDTYIYVPNDGWHKVDGSTINEEFARKIFMSLYDMGGKDPQSVDDDAKDYGSIGNMFIHMMSLDYAIKGNGYIMICPSEWNYALIKEFYIEGGILVDLSDYSAYSMDSDQLRAFVANDGCLYTYKANEKNNGILNHTDADGNIIGEISFAKTEAEHVCYFYIKEDGAIVVYVREGNAYVSWLDVDGNVLKTNYIGGDSYTQLYRAYVAYYEAKNTVVIYKSAGLFKNTKICVVSPYEGETKALFYDSENMQYISANVDDIEFNEKGQYYVDDNRYIPVNILQLFGNDDYTALITSYTADEMQGDKCEISLLDIETMNIEPVHVVDSNTYSMLMNYCDIYGEFVLGYDGVYRITIE